MAVALKFNYDIYTALSELRIKKKSFVRVSAEIVRAKLLDDIGVLFILLYSYNI